MTYEEKALQFVERFGIVQYKVKGHFLIYNQSYPATVYEPHRTYQHTVDLDTMKDTVKQLKRFDAKGYYNT